jgi:hypothetical protein
MPPHFATATHRAAALDAPELAGPLVETRQTHPLCLAETD